MTGRAAAPDQTVRINRTQKNVRLDFSGIELLPGSGLSRLGTLPDWARLQTYGTQYFFANSSPTSIQAALVVIFSGTALYWTNRIVNGVLTDERPQSINGIISYETLGAYPNGGVA